MSTREERALRVIIEANLGGHGFGGDVAISIAKYALGQISRKGAIKGTWAPTKQELDYIDKEEANER